MKNINVNINQTIEKLRRTELLLEFLEKLQVLNL